MSFTCQICFDEKSNRLELPRFATGNGDVLRSADCNHPICLECMATYVRVRVEEQRAFQLRCPMDGCSNEVLEKDLKRLVDNKVMSSDVFKRFAALRARDFNARSKSFDLLIPYTDDDLDFVFALRDMRLCPRCKLVIQRSEGCNSFYCVCGNHFNYANAERPVGHNFAKFRWTAQLAKSRGVSIEEAGRYRGDIRLFKKADLTASQLGISRDSARNLHLRAQEGDEDARVRIREGRCSQHRERRVAEETSDSVDGFVCCHNSLVRRFGDEEGTKLWHASDYEVEVFGAWLPLVKLLAYDVPIPRSESRMRDAPVGVRLLSKLMASRHQLSRWNRSSRNSAWGAAKLRGRKPSLRGGL